MKTIVFDFDKTLTYKDTMNQFFFWRMRGIRLLYWPLFLALVILAKLGFITIKRLKELSIKMLMPRNKEKIMAIFKEFSNNIELCEIFKLFETERKAGSKLIILSASPIYYLKEIFPNIEIIGTTFEFDDNMNFKGIIEHPYGIEKYSTMINRGINTFDEMYYDSKSDEALFPLCKVAHKVKNGVVIKTTHI